MRFFLAALGVLMLICSLVAVAGDNAHSFFPALVLGIIFLISATE